MRKFFFQHDASRGRDVTISAVRKQTIQLLDEIILSRKIKSNEERQKLICQPPHHHQPPTDATEKVAAKWTIYDNKAMSQKAHWIN